MLYLPDRVFRYINLNISGIQAPGKSGEIAEEYYEEAKYFVESRILQRNIKVRLESASGQGNGAIFYGTISHPAGNIAELVLSEGSAKILDWTLSLVDNSESYTKAEQLAKSKSLRIWKAGQKAKPSQQDKEFLGLVKKIVGPDMLIISPVSHPTIEAKYQLASIRGPKRQKDQAGLDIGYYLDAVEFLRHRLVGSKVTVKIEYVKPADGEYEAKTLVSIFKNDKNVGAALLARGLGSVVLHRKDDNDRSSYYNELLDAEHLAIEQKKGIHSGELPVHKTIDISANATKAKIFLADLQRRDSVKAVVEHVFAGSRFKLFLPQMDVRLTFALSGVRTPRASSNATQKEEPFGKEAADFASGKILQRDVEITIENMDKVGAFTGNILFNSGGGKINLATLLLENGLSFVHEGSISSNPLKIEMMNATEKAKKSKLKIWANFQEEKVIQETSTKSDTPTIYKLVVSDIRPDGSFCVQKVGAGSDKLDSMMSAFAAYHRTAPSVPSFKPAVGQYCSAKFSSDGQW